MLRLTWYRRKCKRIRVIKRIRSALASAWLYTTIQRSSEYPLCLESMAYAACGPKANSHQASRHKSQIYNNNSNKNGMKYARTTETARHEIHYSASAIHRNEWFRCWLDSVAALWLVCACALFKSLCDIFMDKCEAVSDGKAIAATAILSIHHNLMQQVGSNW